MKRSHAVAIPSAIAALLVLAACGTATVLPPTQTRPAPHVHLSSGRPAHIAVVVMENTEYGDVIGARAAPYINRLARTYALATGSYAITHPSLPNYLALTGGSTFGISSDCTDCSVPGSGLAGQLLTRRISWKAYMEGLPHPCFTGAGADNHHIVCLRSSLNLGHVFLIYLRDSKPNEQSNGAAAHSGRCAPGSE